MNCLRSSLALTVSSVCLLLSTPVSADITIRSELSGVFPSSSLFDGGDIENDGDVGNLGIGIGRLVFFNGIPVEFDGDVLVDGNGVNTVLETTRQILVGQAANTFGRLEVTDGGGVVTGQDLLVGPTAFSSGVGEFRLTGGAFADLRGLDVAGGDDVNGVGVLDANVLVSNASMTVDSISLGAQGSLGQGRMTVNGASIIDVESEDLFGVVGVAQGSELLISDGATVTARGVSAGFTSSATFPSIPGLPAARIRVGEGGRLLVEDALNAGVFIGAGSEGELVVTGAGSVFGIEVGQPATPSANQGDMLIGVTSPIFGGAPDFSFEEFGVGRGSVLIDDFGVIDVDRDVYVGGSDSFLTNSAAAFVGQTAPNSTGNLIVSSNGRLNAQNVYIDEGGTLSGDGGLISGNVVLRGGTIAPGASPGTLTVGGDLGLFSGSVDFEIGGSTIGFFDQLIVEGGLTGPGGVTFNISFIDGFVPASDETFDILSVFGDSDLLSGVETEFFGLPDGLIGISGANDNGLFSLSFAQGDGGSSGGSGLAPIPLPAGAWLLITGILGMGALRRRSGRRTS